jgi:hypothetical protein
MEAFLSEYLGGAKTMSTCKMKILQRGYQFVHREGAFAGVF